MPYLRTVSFSNFYLRKYNQNKLYFKCPTYSYVAAFIRCTVVWYKIHIPRFNSLKYNKQES